jgi:hypothetical protein
MGGGYKNKKGINHNNFFLLKVGSSNKIASSKNEMGVKISGIIKPLNQGIDVMAVKNSMPDK